jgi:hypothetical protein
LARHAETVTLLTVVAQAVATIALGLLGASGVAKLVDPEPTTGALRAARLPASNRLTRLLATVEIVVAIAALSVGGPSVLGAAVLYTGFGLFTFGALTRRFPLQSCGCFGRADTPPSSLHIAFNVVAAIGLFSLSIVGRSPIDWTLPAVELSLFAGFSVIGVGASYLLLTQLPQLMSLVDTR